MKALANSLKEFSGDGQGHLVTNLLDEANVEFAHLHIRTATGERLTLALNVVKAIAEYTNWYSENSPKEPRDD